MLSECTLSARADRDDPPERDALLAGLRRFGHHGFRPGQRALVDAVLAGRDALGVLPTGGGKSLIYQLPATLLPRVTVVVSPLVALIDDQVEAFNRLGIGRAVALHSQLDRGEARAALADLESGRVTLAYLSPEKFEQPGWRERVAALRPSLLVVDEAHCVCQWGFDFRPSYLQLVAAAAALRPVPVLALTATATPDVRREIVARLGLRDPLLQVASFDRPNLRYEVQHTSARSRFRDLLRVVQGAAGEGSTIIYVGRRRDADEIASRLDGEGFGAVPYHAGMSATARRKAQDAWQSGRKEIAVATIAFGMGIDKPDVRAVIHHRHPSSLEAYSQEAGRAGRDGKPARCVMLHAERDRALAEYFIEQRYPDEAQVIALREILPPSGMDEATVADLFPKMTADQRNVAWLLLSEQGLVRRDDRGVIHRLGGASAEVDFAPMHRRRRADEERLDAMVSYCLAATCHRAALLGYLGEEQPAGYRCGNCSACAGAVPRPRRSARRSAVRERKGDSELGRREVSRAVGLAILGLVGEQPELLPPSAVANVLRGSKSCDAVRARPELGSSPFFGRLAARDYHGLVCDVMAMREKGYLAAARRGRLELTETGAGVLRGRTLTRTP
jgi:ATP-dependent DNA helicase RecQ